MKLWNELTMEQQEAVGVPSSDIGKIIEEVVIEPLVELFDTLSYFFMAAEGLITESQYNTLMHTS